MSVTASCVLSMAPSPRSMFRARAQARARALSLFATIRSMRSPDTMLTRAMCCTVSCEAPNTPPAQWRVGQAVMACGAVGDLPQALGLNSATRLPHEHWVQAVAETENNQNDPLTISRKATRSMLRHRGIDC